MSGAAVPPQRRTNRSHSCPASALLPPELFAGTGYFDLIANTVSAGTSSTTALRGSTEEEQFAEVKRAAKSTPVGEDPACRPILGGCPLVQLPEEASDQLAAD